MPRAFIANSKIGLLADHGVDLHTLAPADKCRKSRFDAIDEKIASAALGTPLWAEKTGVSSPLGASRRGPASNLSEFCGLEDKGLFGYNLGFPLHSTP
jgi:hypothetical protein